MSEAFDVAVVGAGSAGATLASLLSRSGRRVCLIEAGADYRSAATPEAIRGPNFHMALQSGIHHFTELIGRYTEQQTPQAYPAGKGLGGSSAINAQGAVRALASDFEAWVRRGCTGWSWDEVLPAFVRLERDLDFGDRPYHGSSGPIPIGREEKDHWGMVSRALEEVALVSGYPASPDLNAPESTGVSPIPWNRIHGARVSTNDAYLEPVRGRTNLEILPNALVDRLRLVGSRVTGVVVRAGGTSQIIDAGEVIVCAGALHSPAILMRSGIGPADRLRKLGLTVAADRPGVGSGLQDHPMIWLTFSLAPDARAASPHVLPSSCLLRMGADTDQRRGHEVELMPLERTPMDVDRGGFMISWMRPVSQGTLRLVSLDPAQEPEVEFRMLSAPADLAGLRRAVRTVERLTQAAPLRALMAAELSLSPGQAVQDVDDGTLERWLLENCMPHFHASGSCRMGSPQDPGVVVDPACRVIGIDGLRVIDASIMPVLPAAPTHLTTVMLAEHVWRRHFV